MNKVSFLYIFIFLSTIENSYAQWTPSDSIWLKNVLSGKDSLRLNPEIKRAISEGNFIITERKQVSILQPSPNKIPLQVDFSELLKPEPNEEKVQKDLKNLPPQVFWLYSFEPPKAKNQISTKMLDFMKDLKNTPKIKTLYTGDFNDILSTIFSSNYRQLKNNKKNAVAYKTYNDLPSPEIIKKRKQYLEQRPEATLPVQKQETDIQKKDSIETVEAEKNVPPLYL